MGGEVATSISREAVEVEGLDDSGFEELGDSVEGDGDATREGESVVGEVGGDEVEDLDEVDFERGAELDAGAEFGSDVEMGRFDGALEVGIVTIEGGAGDVGAPAKSDDGKAFAGGVGGAVVDEGGFDFGFGSDATEVLRVANMISLM